MDREAFEELFPWRTGWASAVLTEGLLVPAGSGYRFAHEELADWLQSLHLDLPAALYALVHRWSAPSARPPVRPPSRFAAPPQEPQAPPSKVPAAPGGPAEAAVRLPARFGKRGGQPPPVPPAPPVAPAGYPRALPVPRHRAGPVLQALLRAPREELAAHLAALAEALDEGAGSPARAADPDADTVPTWRAGGAARAGARARAGAGARTRRAARPEAAGAPPAGPYATAGRREEARWWAAHLLREALLRAGDAAPYREVLRALAGRIVVRSVAAGGFGREGLGGLGEFGPWFWLRVPLPAQERLELLRVLLPADGPPPGTAAVQERFLTAVRDLLRADPREALPVVCGWFVDDRPLQARGPDGTRLTVASAAQALLHTCRRLVPDRLTDALADAAHPCGDALLAALAEDEPAAVCRAVDRWAHDPRPGRHADAAAHGARAARHARSEADRERLRYAALAILGRPADRALHGAALGILVRDPASRARHLPAALELFADGDPGVPAGAVAAALGSDPEAVLGVFGARLRAGGEAAALLTELAAVREPGAARRADALVEAHLRARPAAAPDVARYLDLRLEQGPQARALLLPLAAALLRDHPAEVRCALVPVFAAPGSARARALRQELLDHALEDERDPDVLDALLTAAAQGAAVRHPLLTRDLVHRLALLLGRTPHGAARFDRRAVALSGAHPPFARLLRTWLADTLVWDALLGPSARRNLDSVG